MSAKREPLPIQYLGMRGTTHPCVEAMVTILTSPYRCRAITVVCCSRYPGEGHYPALFVVWDWLDQVMTIVPDGFGTHQGTGGWGFAVVLDLIGYYQIPLLEKWVSVDQFERIANGAPTERDRKDLHQPTDSVPSWPFHRGGFGPKVWQELDPETAQQFPYWLVEPELMEDVKGAEQDPAGTAFRAARRLEVVVRQLGGFEPHLLGQDLINKAMGNQGQFIPHGATEGESQAWANLFRGVIGAFKNPQSHRDVSLSLVDAAGQILAVNLLIRKLKQDFPDKFREEQAHAGNDDADVSDEEDQ